MAVCRVEKNKNYTTMSNYHLRDPNLSNKARGLLSTMLSLPDNWDYTTRGLAKICKDGVDGITAQLAFVMTLELIQMVSDKNNMHGDVDTWMFFKWIFKTACAVIIVTNTWNIVMGVFDVGQSVVNSAAGVISNDTSIDINSVVTDLEARLMEMDIGPLFGLWFQSLFVGICTWALTICIFIITYGRMIEIYRASRSAAFHPKAVCGHFGNPALASR